VNGRGGRRRKKVNVSPIDARSNDIHQLRHHARQILLDQLDRGQPGKFAEFVDRVFQVIQLFGDHRLGLSQLLVELPLALAQMRLGQ